VWVLVAALASGCRLGIAVADAVSSTHAARDAAPASWGIAAWAQGGSWPGGTWVLGALAALAVVGVVTVARRVPAAAAVVVVGPYGRRDAARGGLRGRRRLAVTALGVLLLGGFVAGGRAAMLDRGPLAELAASGGARAVSGTVVLEPRSGETGTWTVLRLDRVGDRRCRARAFLRVPDGAVAPPLGATVAFRATARPLGRDDFDGYLRSLGAGSAVDAVGPIEVVGPPGALLRVTDAVRANVRAASSARLAPDDAALLSGLVTGDTTGASTERLQAFRDAGLSHLVAVSGSNVALVLGGVLALAAAARLGARGRAVAGLVAVTWFAVLTRGEPSVLRATVCAFVVLLARMTGRAGPPGHALGVAALVLLLADPFLVASLGFVLSVGATAGVLVVAPRVAARIPGPRPLALLVGASVGAQLGVAPFLLGEGLPVAALPANLVAVPAAAVASAIGAGVAVVAQVSVPLAGAGALLAWPALAAVGAIAELASGGPRLEAAALLSPVALGLAVAVVARRAMPRVALLALAVAVVAVALPVVRGPTPVTRFTVTALAVGQGDAVLVEVPAGRGRPAGRMLVDGGPDPQAAVAALRRRGVPTLDAVVVSHPHADHTDGLPAVLRSLEVGALLVGPLPLQADAPASVGALYAGAVSKGIGITAVSSGARFALGSADVTVLSPPPEGIAEGDPNENSLVLHVEHPEGSALLTGDAEVVAQERLLRDPAALRADVLKVPHHGGATNAERFLAAVAPRVALISVGADNDHGHPTPETLGSLRGATVLRTDEGGDATASPADDDPSQSGSAALGARADRGGLSAVLTSAPGRISRSASAPRGRRLARLVAVGSTGRLPPTVARSIARCRRPPPAGPPSHRPARPPSRPRAVGSARRTTCLRRVRGAGSGRLVATLPAWLLPARRSCCSRGRRSCSCAAPPTGTSSSCAPSRAGSSTSPTSGPRTCGKPACPTCVPRRCSVSLAHSSSGRPRSCPPTSPPRWCERSTTLPRCRPASCCWRPAPDASRAWRSA